MPLILPELDLMVLERVSGFSLMDVARVTKAWRFLIAKNMHKMRSIALNHLIFQFQRNGEISIIFHNKHQKDGKAMPITLNQLLKFTPAKHLELLLPATRVLSNKERNNLRMLIGRIPSWWIKQIGKIACIIEDPIFLPIIAQIRSLGLLACVPRFSQYWSIENTKLLISTPQRVDKLGLNCGIDRKVVLEAIIERSLKNPMDFPLLYNPVPFADFINFLERINLKTGDIYILCDLIGYPEQWLDWIERNTTFYERQPLSSKPSRLLVSFYNQDEVRLTLLKHNFVYRGRFVNATISIKKAND